MMIGRPIIIGQHYNFGHVVGVPDGGTKLARALQQYCRPDFASHCIVVDDVLTTGQSIHEVMDAQPENWYVFGVVVFARRRDMRSNVSALFTLGIKV